MLCGHLGGTLRFCALDLCALLYGAHLLVPADLPGGPVDPGALLPLENFLAGALRTQHLLDPGDERQAVNDEPMSGPAVPGRTSPVTGQSSMRPW